MTESLTLGFSPCPNDTFLFYALVHGIVPLPGLQRPPLLADVETLNGLVRNGRLAISKISCHALGHVRRDYALLASGAALGRGCGPLLVARRGVDPAALASGRIAIPGNLTTASLLLRLWQPNCRNFIVLPFECIVPAICAGQVDAGLIIHEARFTYPKQELIELVDLGCWWQELTGLPLPLGAIVAQRQLCSAKVSAIEKAIAASVLYARKNPGEPAAYIRQHAQELNTKAIEQHIALYVNEFTLSLGEEGLAAIEELLGRAAQAQLIPPQEGPLLMRADGG
jgi:1,4-dihydroxy-6-naphthoate synthase